MVTSFLLMATEQPTNQEEDQQQQHMNMPFLGSSEETKNAEPVGRIRGRKGSVKGPKKQPQRGLGVAQLERLRIQESWKKMSESSSSATFTDHHQLHNHHNLLQCHPQMLPFPVHDPHGTNSSTSCGGGVLVRYGAGGAAPNNVQVGFQCPQHQVIHGTSVGTVITGQGPFMGNNNNKSGFVLGSTGVGPFPLVGSCGSGVAPSLWSPLVGTPLETSRVELSSMPNVHSQSYHESFDVCLKKTRFNEDNVKGSNARKEKHLDIRPNGFDFLGYSPQSGAPNLDRQTCDLFYNKPAADATYNDDEGVEVVAVHRKGNSVSGRVFMEYEFFPGKDARGTTSKELESPTFGSVDAVGGADGEASSIITATPFRKTACNCNNVDLSLKLSR